jgi:hypothetical protein
MDSLIHDKVSQPSSPLVGGNNLNGTGVISVDTVQPGASGFRRNTGGQ